MIAAGTRHDAPKPLRLVGGIPRHSAYKFFLARYQDLIEMEAPKPAPALSKGLAGRSKEQLVSITKAAFEVAKSPYLRFVPTGGQVLLSPHTLLLTRARWVVDIEHATPFVGINHLRFDERRTKRLVRRLLERSNCLAVICWTNACRKAFLRKLDSSQVEAKCHVIYPTIATTGASARTRSAVTRLCFVFNEPEHNFYIKSGLEVVEAYRAVRRLVPTMRLDIVGPTPSSVRQILERVEGVSLHGKVSPQRLSEIYADADLLVLPSVTDTFGMVFLEAFAHGLPVLAVDWFAASEIVAHEVNGLLVPKPNGLVSWMDSEGNPTMTSTAFIRQRIRANVHLETSELLAEQILRLARSPEMLTRLSGEALATVTTGKFSPEACSRRVEDLTRAIGSQRL